ncbi:protodermal factor 1-like [Miscanthus floridulus]|uniref:protodermal factor 1-like n=1 Tax=Miscanthus floridulus TaxID=154761 RepID=UPI0034598C26
MEARRTGRALLASFVLAALAAQAFVAVVESRASPAEKASQGDDVKKPDCVPGMDPRSFPGIGGGSITPVTPSHGGSTGTTPSHGGGGGYVPTPSHGGTTLPSPSPSHGGFGSSPTSPSTGGGGYGGSPSHGGGSGSSPTAPSTGGGGYGGGSPSHGGGAYGGSPSTPGGGGAYGGGSPSPAHGGGGAYGGVSPSHGGIGTSSPTPFVPMDPHSFGSLPGSCDYWRSHPMEIWLAIGGRFPSTSPSTMGHFLGAAGSVGGSDVSIQDALANTRSDGTGALLREGAAALLNSMTRAGFPYTTDQVRDAFVSAAAGGSDGAAAAQAAAFRKANEGKA